MAEQNHTEKEEPTPLVVGRAVALTTGIHYIPELDAVINMNQFRRQMAIPQLERAVIDAAITLAEADDTTDHIKAWEDKEESLLRAARALIQARKK